MLPNLLFHALSSNKSSALHLFFSEKPSQCISFDELCQRAQCWHAYYRDKGFQTGDTVAVLLPHSLDLYASYLGALFAGLTPAYLTPANPKMEKTHYEQMTKTLLSQLKFRFIIDSVPELPPPASTIYESTDPESIAFIQYSSGTTGLKKSMGISHKALLWQIDAYAKAIDFSSADTIATWLPLYHDMGLICCFFLPLLKRASIYALSPFEWAARPVSLFELISTHKTTISWLPNFAYLHMTKAIKNEELSQIRLDSIRGLVNCSEPVTANAHNAFFERFSTYGLKKNMLWSCYAMAENTFAVSSSFTNDLPQEDKGRLSSGRVLLGVELEIRENDEIWIRSPSLMHGTADWYSTGDLGYLKGGHLFVTGRSKDLIIIAGRNIFPQEVESLVSSHPHILPGRVACVGHFREDIGTQELIVLAESTKTKETHVLSQEIATLVVNAMGVNPSTVFIVPPRWLQKSSSGKIARNANLERFLQLQKALFESSQAPADPIGKMFFDALSSSMGRPPTQGEMRGRIFGSLLDSISLLLFMLEIERRCAISIPAQEQLNYKNFETLQSIGELIVKLQKTPVKKERVCTIDARDRKCSDYLALEKKDHELLILGSSLTETLSAKRASERGLKAFNFAVSGGVSEDYYCIFRFVEKNASVLPKVLLLGLDVSSFGNVPTYTTLATSPHLNPFLIPELGIQAEKMLPQVSDALNYRFKELLYTMRHEGKYKNYDPLFGDVIYPPSSELLCSRKALHLSNDAVEVQEWRARVDNVKNLKPMRMQYFAETVLAATQRGLFVFAFICPQHEYLRTQLDTSTPFAHLLSQLKGLCAHLSAACPFFLLDLRRPEAFGGDPYDFDDGCHLGAYNSDRLLDYALDAIASKRA